MYPKPKQDSIGAERPALREDMQQLDANLQLHSTQDLRGQRCEERFVQVPIDIAQVLLKNCAEACSRLQYAAAFPAPCGSGSL